MEIVIFTTIIMLILREGFQQRDSIIPNKKIKAIWHGLGWVIRFNLLFLLYILKIDIWFLILAIILMWPVYNIACNIGRKQKWYYVGKNGIDGIIRKILPFIKFDK